MGIVLADWLAVRSGVAEKPDAYSAASASRCPSLFIAGVDFPDRADCTVANVAIFLASLVAAGLGTIIPFRDATKWNEPYLAGIL